MLKKLFFALSLFLFAGIASIYAQSNKKALIEVFTNSHCSLCPAMYNGLNMYVKPTPLNADIIYIFHHINTYNDDALYQETKAESLPRANFYGVNGTPTAALNGTVQDRAYAEYPTRITDAIQQTQDIEISIDGMIKADGLSLTISTDKEIPLNTALYIVVTENIQYKGRNGIAEHNNVMRKMLTGVNGTVPETKNGILFSGDFAFDELNTRNLYNGSIVCFLQNNSTKEIYQTASMSIADFVTASASESVANDIKAYPNPASYGCTIEIPDTGIQVLDIYTVQGEKIQTINSSLHSNQGKTQYYWNGTDGNGNIAPKGIYFVRGKNFVLPVIVK